MAKESKANTKAVETATPTGLPLFYKKPVMLDKKLHEDVSLTDQLSFSFAAKVNAVPVTMIELPNIMQFYPIAFSAQAPATPLAILGVRDNENLFVNEKGAWMENTYIPAYIRRYPFIFAKDETNNQLTLCVDDTEDTLIKWSSNPLFTKEGELTEITKNALEFCRSYQAAAEQTQEFSEAIEASGILIDRHAEIRLNDGQVMTLSGFRQIDETKYYELPEATITEWHKKHWTGFIYAHLFSTGNWQRLFQLIEKRTSN
jgi:SapC